MQASGATSPLHLDRPPFFNVALNARVNEPAGEATGPDGEKRRGKKAALLRELRVELRPEPPLFKHFTDYFGRLLEELFARVPLHSPAPPLLLR